MAVTVRVFSMPVFMRLKRIPATMPVIAFPRGNPMPVIMLPCENPNWNAATNPPTSPVRPPTTGPPSKAAVKVAMWERSRASEKLTGPRGIDGTMGESCIEMKERTLPSAAMRAMKLSPFDVDVFIVTLPSQVKYHY